MEFLRFSNTESMSVPKVFENAFSPSTRVIFLGESDLAAAFCSRGFSLAQNAFHVRFLLDEMLPGTCELEQIHSGIVMEESAVCPGSVGDGLFAARGESEVTRALGIRTADCLAVAFAACVGSVRYGAIVHAGWRGFVEGIHIRAVEQLVGAAEARGISRAQLLNSLDVLVAPAIFGASYECGQDVGEGLKLHYSGRFGGISGLGRLGPVIEACSNVAISGVPRIGAGMFVENKIYPDLQLLMVCDCVLAGVPAGQIRVVRENTWGSPFLYSYRCANLQGRAEGRRLHTHLVFAGVA